LCRQLYKDRLCYIFLVVFIFYVCVHMYIHVSIYVNIYIIHCDISIDCCIYLYMLHILLFL